MKSISFFSNKRKNSKAWELKHRKRKKVDDSWPSFSLTDALDDASQWIKLSLRDRRVEWPIWQWDIPDSTFPLCRCTKLFRFEADSHSDRHVARYPFEVPLTSKHNLLKLFFSKIVLPPIKFNCFSYLDECNSFLARVVFCPMKNNHSQVLPDYCSFHCKCPFVLFFYFG